MEAGPQSEQQRTEKTQKEVVPADRVETIRKTIGTTKYQ